MGCVSGLRLGIFGLPKCIQMDEGGEWQSEVRTDYCPERLIELFPLGLGARPRILGRRNGLARGIHSRLIADDRRTGSQILPEAQWRLNAMIPASGYSAFQLVIGPNPVDLYGWGDQDEDSFCAQGASVSWPFAQPWKLRVMAQEAASKEVAKRKLRRRLA